MRSGYRIPSLQEVRDCLPALPAVFRAEPTVLAAWIFDSVAAGRASPLSDVDFAVLLRPDNPRGLDRLVLLDRRCGGPQQVTQIGLRLPVDVSAAVWRYCDALGGGADRSTQATTPSGRPAWS
jgi:hypothetical protein